MIWLLNKIGPWFTAIGLFALVMLGGNNNAIVLKYCFYTGCVAAFIGLLMGKKFYEADVSPYTLLLSSSNRLMDNIVSSCLVWAIRFFFMPFIAGMIYELIKHS